jgi:peptidoglycan/xylan/chitin deacetylase (PgdA/CDA1 family)
VLAYHDVEETRSTFFSVTPAELRSQLAAVRDAGATIVALDDLVARWRAGESIDGLVAVSFDDALLGLREHALGILRDLEVPATVFATTADLGMPPPWWKGSRRVLTRAELHEVLDAGLVIGSHTRTHPSLPQVDDARLDDEVRGSKAELEELTGRSVTLFAYPRGHFDPRVRAAVADAGYEAAFSFLNGRVLPTTDRYRMPRITMGSWHHRTKMIFDVVRLPSSRSESQLEEER